MSLVRLAQFMTIPQSAISLLQQSLQVTGCIPLSGSQSSASFLMVSQPAIRFKAMLADIYTPLCASLVSSACVSYTQQPTGNKWHDRTICSRRSGATLVSATHSHRSLETGVIDVLA